MSLITTWGSDPERTLVGAWSVLGPAPAEALTLADVDWVALDGQHGAFDDQAVRDTLRRVPRGRKDIIVRVPENGSAWIGRVLDAGARGVIVPMVETAADAELAAHACRYPPLGGRSWGQMGGSWGRPEISVDESNADVVCAVMIENQLGLDNVDQITAVPGVDMVYVGPFDMSIALGLTITELMEQGRSGPLGVILAACERNNVIPGAFAGSVARAAVMREMGFRVLAIGTDHDFLLAGSGRAAETVRAN